MTRYVIGDLHDPQPEDLLRPFATEQAAIEAAWERANCDDRRQIAVWDSEDTPLWLFTAGIQWRAT